MSSESATLAEFPHNALCAAIHTLKAKGLEASILTPDDSPSEIFVVYLPAHRRGETFMQDFMRAQADTAYCRVWAASDGTVRVTNDALSQERSYGTLEDAVSALVVRSSVIGGA